jgi:hypothetical protein
MSSDIRDILQRLSAVAEGTTTPVSVKKGQNPQQRSVPQLPALFKPRSISVLGANTDPEHPMKGYAVGANESRLAETMQEIEEDMLNRVKKDLTHYLDQLNQQYHDDGRRDPDSTPDLDSLTKKEKLYRDMIAKAVDAIDSAETVEELGTVSENDYELSDPSTVHDVEDQVDSTLAQPQQPVQVMEIGSGPAFEVHSIGPDNFEIRRGSHRLPTSFRSQEEADIALQLFRSRYKDKTKNTSADYIEER